MRIILIDILLITLLQPAAGLFAQEKPATGYLPGTVIFKIKKQYSAFCARNSISIPAIIRALNSIPVTSLQKKFPNHHTPPMRMNRWGEQLTDLSLIYEVKWNSGIPVHKVINALMASGTVEYAQPHYTQRPLYTPNDPSISSQYYLSKINAFLAWDISKGDTNTVIGIVDTGTDPDHPDLAGNVKYNYADPPDGADNDNDGFTDNFAGWDLAENDNDPIVAGSSNWLPHGSYMAGMAAAVTDNATGIAGTGFKCKFLPVKVNTDAEEFTMGYEGIVYAADHGCSIINCSWGANDTSPYESDIIRYATINKNALIIAAAGNDGDEVPLYPASFDYVLSVAGTDVNDVRYYASPTNSSSYGIFVDVSAPGKDIYSTLFDNGYSYGSGTSSASAITSACAAIVKSYRPWLYPMQIAAQLKVTTDNIDTIPGNSVFAGKLGSGRINLYRALTDTLIPSIALLEHTITDFNDHFFVPADTLRINATFINWLEPATSVTVTINSQVAQLTFTNDVFTAGAMATLEQKNNYPDPFTIIIGSGVPYNSMAAVKFNYIADTFSSYEYIQIPVNLDYRNVTVNALHTTLTSKGRIGYNDTLQFSGLGLKYSGSSTLIYEAGLMVGNSTGINNYYVSDNVRGTSGYDKDFRRVTAIAPPPTAGISDFDLYCAFNDENAGSGKLKILMKQKSFAWASPADSNYIILEYTVVNNNTASLDSLYTGIFADWDIEVPSYNRAGFDSVKRMGYVYSSFPGGLYGGIKLLTPGVIHHYSFDNVDCGGCPVNPVGGLSSKEKYIAMSSNQHSAGSTGPGSDVISMVSSGPFALSPGDSVRVAFALMAGNNLSELFSSADAAQAKYDSLFPSVRETQKEEDRISLFPNPATDRLIIQFGSDVHFETVELISITGSILLSWKKNPAHVLNNARLTLDISHLAQGIYFCRIRTAQKEYFRKFAVVNK